MRIDSLSQRRILLPVRMYALTHTHTHTNLQTLREMHIELNYVFEHLRMRTHTGREFYYQSPIGQ